MFAFDFSVMDAFSKVNKKLFDMKANVCYRFGQKVKK